MPAFKELPPIINGFKVIRDLGTSPGGRRRYLIAECKICQKHFEVERDSLRAKTRRSCGCKLHYTLANGYKRTNIPKKLRSTYSGMIARCYNKDHLTFHNYGAKSIEVCDEWKNNNKSFFKWALENNYKIGLTLDRINASKGYSPDNCRFVTMAVNIQSRTSITKFNPDIIRKMRKDCLTMTTRAVAKKYSVSHHHLIDIKLKRSWNNIQDE